MSHTRQSPSRGNLEKISPDPETQGKDFTPLGDEDALESAFTRHEPPPDLQIMPDEAQNAERAPTTPSSIETPLADPATPRANATAQDTEHSVSSSNDNFDLARDSPERQWNPQGAPNYGKAWYIPAHGTTHYAASPEQFSQDFSRDSPQPTPPPPYATQDREAELFDDAAAQFKSDVPNTRHVFTKRVLSLQSDTESSYYTADSGYSSGRSNTNRPSDRAIDLLTEFAVFAAKECAHRSTRHAEACTSLVVELAVAEEVFDTFCRLVHFRAKTADELAAVAVIKHDIRRISQAFCGLLQDPVILVHEAASWPDHNAYVANSYARVQAVFEAAKDTTSRTTPVLPLNGNYESALAFVTKGEEFSWLTAELCLAANTTPTGSGSPNIRRTVLDFISDGLKYERDNTITLDWCPSTFLEKQYPGVVEPSIGDCIAYCGSGDQIEAIIVVDYLTRMWQDIAKPLLSLLQTTLSMNQSSKLFEQPQTKVGNASLAIKHHNDQLQATICRSPTSQLQIIEALIWLGAACRASPHLSITASCSPELTIYDDQTLHLNVGYKSTLIKCSLPGRDPQMSHAAGSPKASVGAVVQEAGNASALCWLSLVRNPSVADGYPILRRQHDELGLEIPFAMLITLSTATRAAILGCITVIKSFCSMLIATRHVDGSSCWHYILNKDQEPISYAEAPAFASEDTRAAFEALQESRHFVGWSKHTTTSIGTEDCNYDVDFTGTNYSRGGLGFDGFTVGAGQYISVSSKIVPGNKDTVLSRNVPNDYDMQIKQAETMRVVLYDVLTSRAWLVDGAEALLYLSRAYLSSQHAPQAGHGESKRLVEAFMHRSEAVSRANTAYKVLLARQNRALALHLEDDDQDLDHMTESDDRNTGTTMRYEALVVHFYELLGQIQGHFEVMHRSQKWSIGSVRNIGQPTLEGVDFADLLTLRSGIRPRTVPLKESARMWLPMTGHMSAVHLFGSGFGEVIKASDTCPGYEQVPAGLDLLASSAKLLNTVATEIGRGTAYSLQIAEKCWWNMPLDIFEHEACHKSLPHTAKSMLIPHHILEPEKWSSQPLRAPKRIPLTEYLHAHPSAAVIMGDKSRVGKIPAVRPTVETNSLIWPTQASGPNTLSSSATNTDTTNMALSWSSSLGTGHVSTVATSVQASPASRTPIPEELDDECESQYDDGPQQGESKGLDDQTLDNVSIDALWAELARRGQTLAHEPGNINEHLLQRKRPGDQDVAERPSKLRRTQAVRPQARRKSGILGLHEQYRMDES